MARAGKPLCLALLVGRRPPGDPRRWDCVFSDLEKAQQWCIKHADERGCSAEVVLGTTVGGRVLWRRKGPAKKGSRRSPQMPDDEIQPDLPPDLRIR